VSLLSANIAGDVRMMGSTFETGINADYLHVGGTLFLREGAAVRGGPLALNGANIANDLDMSHSVFEAGINANGAHIGGDLYLHNGAAVRGGAVSLVSANIGSDLWMTGSTFETGINGDRLHVGGSLFLGESATVRGGPLRLTSAKIDGDIELTESNFESEIKASTLGVGKNILAREAVFSITPDFTSSHVAENVDLSNSELPGLDFTRVGIGGDLRVAWPDYPPPRWQPNAKMILRDAHVGAIQDDTGDPSKDPWPCQLDLVGFSYDRFGESHDASWAINWLARDRAATRQPYQQLATAFRLAGDFDKAEAVLTAARDRDLRLDWHNGKCRYGLGLLLMNANCWSAVGLGLLKITIGYGIGRGYFLALVWVVGFTVVGALVLRCSPHAREHGRLWCLGASLSRLLPVIELNKEFVDFFNDPNRWRLKAWQLTYFAGHAVMGYVLASFIVAALAGLTQAR